MKLELSGSELKIIEVALKTSLMTAEIAYSKALDTLDEVASAAACTEYIGIKTLQARISAYVAIDRIRKEHEKRKDLGLLSVASTPSSPAKGHIVADQAAGLMKYIETAKNDTSENNSSSATIYNTETGIHTEPEQESVSEFKSPEPGHHHHPQHTEDEKTESNHSKDETTSDNKTERKTGIKERVMIVSK